MPHLALALIAAISLAACRSGPRPRLDPAPTATSSRHVYPLAHAAHAPACPPVEIDCTDYPAGAEWGALARGLVETWYPKLCELLATDGRDPISGQPHGKPLEPPAAIRVVIAAKLDVPAYTAGTEIHVNGPWVAAHPEDSGLLIHELAHVVQRYPARSVETGWLVEGIADYLRWWRYEPELAATAERTRIDLEKSKYSDSYRTTGMWLAWCSRKFDLRLVPALDLALRNGEDPLPVFGRVCGKDAEELWKLFVAEWR